LSCNSVGSKKKKGENKRKEVFDIRKRRKKTNISTYQLEGTLVLDLLLATVYICANHNYLLFLVPDHLGLHLEHVLDQKQFAHLNPYSTLLLCYHPRSTFIPALQVSSSQSPRALLSYTLPCI
jgi:hypothetical protein